MFTQEEKNPVNKLQDAIDTANKNGWELVPKKTSSANTNEIKSEIKSILRELFNITENLDMVADILMGQLYMETGFRSIHNNNVGNIKAHGTLNQFWRGKVFPLLVHEYNKNKEKYYVYSLFRHYDSLKEGIGDWAALLKRRFPKAVDEAAKGNAEGFVQELKNRNYFTASVDSYLAGVQSWRKKQKSNISTTPVSTVKSPQIKPEPSKEYDTMISKLINTHKPIDTSNLENTIDNLLKTIRASDKNYKSLYKKYLPNNSFTVSINSDNKINSIEFARILSMALDEELLSDSFIHTNGDDIEIECNISGSENLCKKAISQLTDAILDAFKVTTSKFDNININTNIKLGKSLLPSISINASLSNYRKFYLKVLGQKK